MKYVQDWIQRNTHVENHLTNTSRDCILFKRKKGTLPNYYQGLLTVSRLLCVLLALSLNLTNNMPPSCKWFIFAWLSTDKFLQTQIKVMVVSGSWNSWTSGGFNSATVQKFINNCKTWC
ncbi:hypothetical protein QTP88_003959 [Uroleucon formosanum]